MAQLIKQGDVVVAVVSGDFGKPRPALVIQHKIHDHDETVILCPITSHIAESNDYRIPVTPSETNGLNEKSFIAIDKITAVKRIRIKQVIGAIDHSEMNIVSSFLIKLFGL